VAQKSFNCRLVTPEAEVLNQPSNGLTFPAWDGSMGVLPMRAPFVTKLGMGELRISFPDDERGRGGSRGYFIEGGFCEMHADEITILARYAVPEESLSLSDIEAELKEAEARNLDSIPDVEERRKHREEITRLRSKLASARQFLEQGGI